MQQIAVFYIILGCSMESNLMERQVQMEQVCQGTVGVAWEKDDGTLIWVAALEVKVNALRVNFGDVLMEWMWELRGREEDSEAFGLSTVQAVMLFTGHHMSSG